MVRLWYVYGTFMVRLWYVGRISIRIRNSAYRGGVLIQKSVSRTRGLAWIPAMFVCVDGCS